MCFLHVKIKDGRPAWGKTQNDQSIVNQLKMFSALLFEVIKTIKVSCKNIFQQKHHLIFSYTHSLCSISDHTLKRGISNCARENPTIERPSFQPSVDTYAPDNQRTFSRTAFFKLANHRRTTIAWKGEWRQPICTIGLYHTE